MGRKTTRLEFRPVDHSDGAGITELLSNIPMPGPVGIGNRYSAPFWDAFAVEGNSPKGVVALSKGLVVGVGLITRRMVWLKGRAMEVGYLNSLRLAPEYRNGFAVARGFNRLREIHQRELGLPIYLTSIMQGNNLATKALLGKRAGLPEYQWLSSYKTFALPTWKRVRSDGRLEVLPGREAGLDTVLHCLRTFGMEKDLFPVIEAEDIIGNEGFLRGLDLDSFHVAYKAGEPIGTAAVWDQSPFKKFCITGYRGVMKPVEKVSNFLVKAGGSGIIPSTGATFSPAYLSCLAIKNNDPMAFKGLVSASISHARRLKKGWLLAGLFANDPLVNVLRNQLKFTFDSNIYRVLWDDWLRASIQPGPALYLDVGSL